MGKPKKLPILEIVDHFDENTISDGEMAMFRQANKWLNRKRNKLSVSEDRYLLIRPRDCLELGLNLTDLVVFTEIVRWFRWRKNNGKRSDRPITRLRVNGKYYVKASPGFLAKQFGNDTKRNGTVLSEAAIRCSLKQLEAKGLIELLSGWDPRGTRLRRITLARPIIPPIDPDRYTTKVMI